MPLGQSSILTTQGTSTTIKMEKLGRKIPRYRKVRIGDRVEMVLKPIAQAIDSVAGTDIKNCSGCKKRKEWLNRKFTKLVNGDGENATT